MERLERLQHCGMGQMADCTAGRPIAPLPLCMQPLRVHPAHQPSLPWRTCSPASL